MAGARRSWIWPLALAVLIVGAGAAQSLVAQEAAGGGTGSIVGKLTDLHSMPVEGAVVVLRNEATGAELRSTTLKNGIYSFIGLDSGSYAVEAESELLGRGRLEHIFVAAGDETRVQTAMEFEPAPQEPVQSVRPLPSQPLQEPAVSARSLPDRVQATVDSAAQKAGTAQETAGKIAISDEKEENLPSGAKALPHSAESLRGLKPPPPPALEPLPHFALNPPPSSASSSPAIRTVQAPSPGAVQTSSRNASQVTKSAASPGLNQAASPNVSRSASRAMSQTAVKPNAADAALIPAVTGPNRISQVTGAGWSLAIDEAVAAVVQVAAQSRQAIPKPMKAAGIKEDPVTPVVTTKVSGAELQALPASGRRWQDFVLDTPAAATAAGGRAQASLRGAGQLTAESSIDGASIRLAFGGQGGYGPGSSGQGSNGQGGREQNGMGQAWAAGRGSQVAEAAIREVQMAAGSAEAEGLRTAGGRVNVETARGGNGLHGQVFLFDRQNTWGAQNPFTQWVKQTGLPTLTTTPSVYRGAVYAAGPRDGLGGGAGQPDPAGQAVLVWRARQLRPQRPAGHGGSTCADPLK